MRLYTIRNYHIEIVGDPTYSENSVDNVNEYDLVYLDKSAYDFPSTYGIRLYEGEILLRSALIGATGYSRPTAENTAVVQNDCIVLCCGDMVFCLSLPALTLLWKTKADTTECQEIFEWRGSYIVHGECNITRPDKNGTIVWQKRGGDIFVTPSGEDAFAIDDDQIVAKDWEGRKYRFDFNGNLL